VNSLLPGVQRGVDHAGMSSTAYWYAAKPAAVAKVPPVTKRLPVLRDNQNNWLMDKRKQTTSRVVKPNREMLAMKRKWKKTQK